MNSLNNPRWQFLGLVAEPARPAEAEAGCLSGPAGLGGITSLVITLRICWDWDIKVKYSTSSLLYRFQFKLDLLIIRNDFLANLSYIMWYIVLKVHPIAKNSLRLLGGPFPSPRPLPVPDFASKVRPGRQGRPSALGSRPPALTILLSMKIILISIQ